MKKGKKIGVAILILSIWALGFFSYHIFQFAEFMDELGECAMMAGPIYGDPIIVNVDSLSLEQEINIPNGKFGLISLSDSLPPKLIKYDLEDSLIWAVEFREDTLIGIPHQRLSEMTLRETEQGYILSFFNVSNSEPGNIYLTENFELEYMCLSLM